MKKYLTKDWSEKIAEVEVERETDESVWVNGRRQGKATQYAIYHDTFDAAKTYLIDRYEKDIRVARDKIHRAESALGDIRKLTAPTDIEVDL